MLWRDMRGRTKEINKELQDLDPLCSPHLEERLIGGNKDLDLLSLSLKDMQESWEKLREGQAFQGQQWRGERGENELTKEEEGEGHFYPLP
jgi:hypothetical protein